MASITDETVFQGEVPLAKCLSSLSEMVQRQELGACLAICPEQVQTLVGYVQHPVRWYPYASQTGRKKAKTSDMLIFTDSRGIPLSCSDPIEGNHNDAFELVRKVGEMIGSIQSCGIATDGLFLNSDAGFDVEDFRALCYQQEIVDNIDNNSRNGDNEDHLF